MNIIPNTLEEEDVDLVIDEINKDYDFEKTDTEMETYDSIEEPKYPPQQDSGIIVLDNLKEKEMNDPRVQATFKRSRHKNSSIFIINQDYYELPKRTIRANGTLYHIFEANNFRDVKNLYQDKQYMDMTNKGIKYLSSSCSGEKYQPLAIDMTENKKTGRYRLGLNSLFVPNTNPFRKL